MVAAAPLFPSHLFPPKADNQSVGEVILQALSDCRTLMVEECDTFFNLEKTEGKYSVWIVMLMDKYGYKTKRTLFKEYEKLRSSLCK